MNHQFLFIINSDNSNVKRIKETEKYFYQSLCLMLFPLVKYYKRSLWTSPFCNILLFIRCINHASTVEIFLPMKAVPLIKS